MFHRVPVGTALELPGPLYFQLANRLGAYAGVMQSRILKRQQDEEQGITPHHAPTVRSGQGKPQRISDDAHLAQLANEGWLEKG